jgi:hypothetical protein
MVNPNNDQPEKYLFNNFIYKNIFVNKDDEAPWLDVTFDGVHILNRDIVSAKPERDSSTLANPESLVFFRTWTKQNPAS